MLISICNFFFLSAISLYALLLRDIDRYCVGWPLAHLNFHSDAFMVFGVVVVIIVIFAWLWLLMCLRDVCVFRFCLSSFSHLT